MVRMLAEWLVRFASWCWQVWPPLGTAVKTMNHVVSGADVSPEAMIGSGFTMYHPTGVVIGPDVVIGNRCVVQQNVTLGHGRAGSPTLEDGVAVGPGAVIVGGYRVGRGSIVGANSVVTCHIPPMEIWAGIPARLIRAV